MELVFFRLPGHGNMTLKHMNSLRSRQHFCDITIVASNNQTFRGHKVVLAACSPFLRDQFLLNPSSRLQVSMLYSSTVVCDLLQSCYTGILQFNPEEIVNYLTAASYLQMEHIVERCRGALEKYVQLKNPSQSKTPTEETETRPVIVSGSVHSVASPPPRQPSPVHSHSPVVRSVEESNGELSAQGSSQLHDDSAALDEGFIKVHASDEDEEARQENYNMLRVYISENEHTDRDREEEKGAPSEVPQGANFSETEEVVIGESGEYDLNPAGLSSGEFSAESLRALSRRISETNIGHSRGRGRGRGLKRKRWVSSQEKRPIGITQHQDLWYLTSAGGGFGLDYSQEGLRASRNIVTVEIPELDFSMGSTQGEKVSPIPANSLNQFSLEESACGAGEGSSGLTTVGTNEGSDESVAVVGSTSSVAGPVICEHCNMTFPSAHSLAIHSRSTHLLYACPCCGKHFHHSTNLTRHMAVHRGAGKTHQCPLCYKTFTQKSTLIDHMNLHSGERPHRCAYCHAHFAHKPALRRHLKEQHGKTTGQNSLHEQEERERARGAAGRIREEEQECLVTE
ncbi:zinc finger and BTB domain-containing protein 12-like [Pundamilia nyererei]|uniref:Zinc finger and BTB domain-containing protein 12-like n=3 Tax=Pseudocrenilabrinae TaxID=318546 RepID=A0A3B4GN34_9CICH|nr:PREDICTED: zinc finger and BTB domain-containing protein 12-like [Pundamilia nyererei]XP_005748734.1 PREDICTED: zinc finger and BTB domain-containing protein 12-like [Pundamilia nyererei]XP_026012299.1 zinc finger and BTB domain-containing protein 12-like [Astatotilapia calliptera]XP_039877453.1 zinc finger and BTB domain-containing protein 12-like isoform X2 [Simochromis diagramma]XP_039877454.1 zinc finger and BTB domain-containing protein 12-like isoform X2 [Simochromis diagramma]XP_0398